MRFDHRIVNFGDANATTFDRRPADGNLRPGRRQPPPGGLPAVQGALRRARPLAAADAGRGVREADAAFTADRLHDQRDRIMRRIERHDHPAEVVAFPHQRVPSHATAVQRMLGPARRWVAGAAAAGLAAGLFLGFAMDRSSHLRAVDRAMQQSNRIARPPGCRRRSILHRDRRGAGRLARARDAPRSQRD